MFILQFLSVNNHGPAHAELVMNGADVIESSWNVERNPKTRRCEPLSNLEFGQNHTHSRLM